MAAFVKPPEFAETLLELALPANSRETVSGDLLEEYRDARVPLFGRVRANLWYLRQVAGIFLRAYWWFGAPLVLTLVIHDIFNAFRDPSGASYLERLVPLPFPPLFAVAVFFIVAGYGSWRTRRWAGGFVAALGTFVMLWSSMAVWWAATFYPFAQVQQSNPYWIQAWHWSLGRAQPTTLFGFNPDTPNETFLRWIFWDNVGALIMLGISMMLLATVCGSIGSTIGNLCRSKFRH
jgi:hypothetical protein